MEALHLKAFSPILDQRKENRRWFNLAESFFLQNDFPPQFPSCRTSSHSSGQLGKCQVRVPPRGANIRIIRERTPRASVSDSAEAVREGERSPKYAGPAKISLNEDTGILNGASNSPFRLALLTVSKVIPHPAKVEKGGEDAHLIKSDVWGGAICVADGVGGWAEEGVDPSLYSREFVRKMDIAVTKTFSGDFDPKRMRKEAESEEGGEGEDAALDASDGFLSDGEYEGGEESEGDEERNADVELNVRLLLHLAHRNTHSPGAATAILAVLDDASSILKIANLGDSGLRVIRNGHVVFSTPSQQHYFDCPYQFGSESTDSANDAQVFFVRVEEGDVVVLGSDGLFDNVFDRDIAAVVNVFGGGDEASTERTAAALAALASKHANDDQYISPYVEEAVQQGQDLPPWRKMLGQKLQGGKLDDITVVVAQVVRKQE